MVDVEEVIIVGGATRTPCVRAMLQEIFPAIVRNKMQRGCAVCVCLAAAFLLCCVVLAGGAVHVCGP